MNFINYKNKTQFPVFDFKITSKLFLTAAYVLSVNLYYSFFIYLKQKPGLNFTTNINGVSWIMKINE